MVKTNPLVVLMYFEAEELSELEFTHRADYTGTSSSSVGHSVRVGYRLSVRATKSSEATLVLPFFSANVRFTLYGELLLNSHPVTSTVFSEKDCVLWGTYNFAFNCA